MLSPGLLRTPFQHKSLLHRLIFQQPHLVCLIKTYTKSLQPLIAPVALSSIFSATPTILLEQVFDLIENGLVSDNLPAEVNALVTASFSGMNSETNVNPAANCSIYPQKNCTDAPYTLTEEQLRQVIYIPTTFTYGQVPPVIVGI